MAGKRNAIFIAVSITAIGLGGFWYYDRLQNTLEPTAVPESNVSPGPDIPELGSQVLIENLSNVWDVGFLPDKTMLFNERVGTISKSEDNRKVVIHTIKNIYAVGEAGLMGLAIDPEFAQNHYIYACYSTPTDIRLSRWKVNDTVTTLTDQADIIIGMPINKTTFLGRHSGCRPRFGNDKNLWVGTGDVAIGTNPQDPKSLGGKILRIDRDGNAVQGNLGEPYDTRIFSYGHRNTQGLALFGEPKDGFFGYSIEHGSSRDDEINPLRTGNFGWDPAPGYNESVMMTDKQKYPDAVEAIWSSGTPTIAPSGASFITGAKWGGYEGRLAVAILKDKYVRLFKFDPSGKKVLEEHKIFTTEFGRIRSVIMGPRDDLYLTTDNGHNKDKIIRAAPK